MTKTPAEQFKERKRKVKLATCQHFTGIPLMESMAKDCRKGIAYASVTSSRGTYACCQDERWAANGAPRCASFEPLTEADLDAREARMNISVERLLRGVSSCCEAPLIHGQSGKGRANDHGPHFCSSCKAVAYWV